MFRSVARHISALFGRHANEVIRSHNGHVAVAPRAHGRLDETVIDYTHTSEECKPYECPSCDRTLTVLRQPVARSKRWPVELKDLTYCTTCRKGFYPLDTSLEVVASRYQVDVQQAIAKLCAETPYETAHALLGD